MAILPVHQMIDKPDFLGNFRQGVAFGQQQQERQEKRADQQQMRQLAPGVIGGDPAAFAQAAALDPEAAAKMQGAGDQQMKRLEGLLKLLDDADARNPQEAQALWTQYGVPYARQFSQGTEPVADWAQAKTMLAPLKAKIAMARAGGGVEKPDVKVVGDALVDETGRVLYQGRPNSKYFQTDQGLVEVGPDGQAREVRLGGAPQPMPAPTTGAGSAIMAQSFDEAVSGVLGREGGFVANDAGAGPTNYGINSRANPDVDVANLTPDAAKQLYKSRYWDAIDADNLPPAIRGAAFDAAVNMGPGAALGLLRASGGDPQRFMQLRQQRYDQLVASNPQKYGQYAEGWRNRNQATAGAQTPTDGSRPLLPAASLEGRQRLELAQQANQRAEEAAERARAADERAARAAEQREKFGNVPAGFRIKADGSGLEAVPGGPKPKGSAATEGERKAATLLQRLNGSLAQLQAATRENPEAASPSVGAEIARSLPLIGEVAANTINTPERQRVEAAQLDMLDAALTLGTGAAYTREQLQGYRKAFFPQIGDDDTTIADKQKRLENVISAARIAAGRAAPQTEQAPQGRYQVGQVIEANGKRYRVTGGDPNDPDVEEVP